MEIEVIRIEEYADGSADVELHIDEETKRWLINHAFLDILSKGLDNMKKLHESDIDVKFDI